MDWYLWTKALHIIAVICWMAGLLYLPRLFIYHLQLSENDQAVATFKVMERRLLNAITLPSMVFSLITGLLLLFYFGNVDWQSVWLWFKLLSVTLMIAATLFVASCQKAFAEDRNSRSERFYRIINEVPALLMIIIVVAVVVRPF